MIILFSFLDIKAVIDFRETLPFGFNDEKSKQRISNSLRKDLVPYFDISILESFRNDSFQGILNSDTPIENLNTVVSEDFKISVRHAF